MKDKKTPTPLQTLIFGDGKALWTIVYGGAIAAVYVALTLAFAPISFGPIQFRISEALCVLPYFTPAAVPGLFIGCLFSNLLGTAVPMDVVCGSLATLIGAMGSRALRRHRMLVCLPPIATNTIIVPWVLRIAYGVPDMLPYLMLTVGIGEVLAIGVLGNALLFTLERYRNTIFRYADVYGHR